MNQKIEQNQGPEDNMSQVMSDKDDGHGMSRREFILTLLAGGGTLFTLIYGLDQLLNPSPKQVRIDPFSPIPTRDTQTQVTPEETGVTVASQDPTPAVTATESETTINQNSQPEPTNQPTTPESPPIIAEYEIDQATMQMAIYVPSAASQAEVNAPGETIELNFDLLAVPPDSDFFYIPLAKTGTYSIDGNLAFIAHSGYNLFGVKLSAEKLRYFLQGGTFTNPGNLLTETESKQRADKLLGSRVLVNQKDIRHTFQVSAVGNITRDQLEEIRAQIGGEPAVGHLTRYMRDASGDPNFQVLKRDGNIVVVFCTWGDRNSGDDRYVWGRCLVVLSPVS